MNTVCMASSSRALTDTVYQHFARLGKAAVSAQRLAETATVTREYCERRSATGSASRSAQCLQEGAPEWVARGLPLVTGQAGGGP